MNKEPFTNMPDVLNAKQLAEALHLSKAGAYNLLNADDFPILKIGGRKLVMKPLAEKAHQWSRAEKNRKQPITTARTHHTLSEQFLFENRCFLQFKSRGKSPKNATLAEWSAERS